MAGHSSCELRRYLDSVPLETPIRDVVDRCRVWKSHADPEIGKVSKPGPDPIYPAYMIGDSDKVVEVIRVAAVTKPKSASDQVEELLRRLLAGVATLLLVPGKEIVTASGGGNADSTACSGGGVRTSGIGNYAQIATVGTDGVGATALTGIFPE